MEFDWYRRKLLLGVEPSKSTGVDAMALLWSTTDDGIASGEAVSKAES